MSSLRSLSAIVTVLLLALSGASCGTATDDAGDAAATDRTTSSASPAVPTRSGDAPPSYAIADTWDVPGVGSVFAALDTSTGQLFATNMETDELVVVDVATGNSVATVGIPGTPTGVAVDPATGTALVAQMNANQVSVVSTQSHEVMATIEVGGAPIGVGIDPSSDLAYVATYTDNAVAEVDASTGSVSRTFVGSVGPTDLAIDQEGRALYVMSREDGLLSVYDLAAEADEDDVMSVAGQIQVSVMLPQAIVVDPSAHRIFVSSSYGKTLAVVDTAVQQEITVVPLKAYDIDVDLAWHRIFVVTTKGEFLVLDSEGQTITRLKLDKSASAVVVDQTSGSAYVVGAGKVWCIDPA